MNDIDQKEYDRTCDGIKIMYSGPTAMVDKTKEHEPCEMEYQGLHGFEVEDGPWAVFECPVCQDLRLHG